AEQVSLVAVAVVFLAGNAVGSAAPTPGGLGAVEVALIGGLTAVAGVPAAVALPAVLLFRLLTFWLPVLPGWAAFPYLQRREALCAAPCAAHRPMPDRVGATRDRWVSRPDGSGGTRVCSGQDPGDLDRRP